MPWELKTILSILAIYITSVVGGFQNCADVDDITQLEYSQQGAKLQVKYLLLTRRNINCASVFNQETLTSSFFNSFLPTKIVVHGFSPEGRKPPWIKGLTRALLRAEDVNVVVVNWVYSSAFNYKQAVKNCKEVAVEISVLINQLQNHGCKLDSFHLIGFSLGAHVSGFVGTIFRGKIGRITGLDPAASMFEEADTFGRLDPSDALFVEAIHTDSGNFGISIPVGHVDFFLNGGADQTGCVPSRFASWRDYVICDHKRAVLIYISALSGFCPLTGIPCSSYEDFLAGYCLSCEGVLHGICPRIGGIAVSPFPREQKLFLLTTFAPPFCAHHILLELVVSQLDTSAEVEVTLKTQNLATKQILRLQTNTTVYRRVVAHPEALCKIDSILLNNTEQQNQQGDVHIVSVCLFEFPSISRQEPLCMRDINIRRRATWFLNLEQVCSSY